MNEEQNFNLKTMRPEERPMEKMMRFGAKALSTGELLAILIGTGNRTQSALEIGEELVGKGNGETWLLRVNVEELMAISGIGKAKACRIVAGIALGQRLTEIKCFSAIQLSNPQSMAEYFRTYLCQEEREIFCSILLNAKCQPMRTVRISEGTLTETRVHPREVFQAAVRTGCVGMVLAHNHPSGDPEPSPEDIAMTTRLVEAGKLLGIPVYDHIIVGGSRYVSFRERKIMTPNGSVIV